MNLANSQDKVNTQKSLIFLYIKNEKLERKIKESIPFRISTTTQKTSRNKPTQGDKRTVYRKL